MIPSPLLIQSIKARAGIFDYIFISISAFFLSLAVWDGQSVEPLQGKEANKRRLLRVVSEQQLLINLLQPSAVI